MFLTVRPDWPTAKFQRTIEVGKQKRVLVFNKGELTKVSDAEFKALSFDVGKALVEGANDAGGRLRYYETQPERSKKKEPATDAANV